MQNLLIALVSLISFNVYSQETITSSQAKDFVGKEVFLIGKVAGTKILTSPKGNLLKLNIDKDYPDQDISIVIFNEVLAKLKLSETDLLGKSVKAKGIINIYKDKPQIILENEVNLIILQ